jgi:hypothetical protein
MNLEDLKKELPFKWRVQSANQWGAQCVAYIDARDVQDRLDEVCGPENWQCKYTEHKGNLFCSIGIRMIPISAPSTFGEFTWKEDCGTESNVEKQKGEASDAFKRAAVMWGIGRFLYSMKIIKLDVVKDDKGKFQPAENGKRIYTDKINQLCTAKLKGVTPPASQPEPKKKTTLIVNSKEFFNGLEKKASYEKMKEYYFITEEVMKAYLKALEDGNN